MFTAEACNLMQSQEPKSVTPQYHHTFLLQQLVRCEDNQNIVSVPQGYFVQGSAFLQLWDVSVNVFFKALFIGVLRHNQKIFLYILVFLDILLILHETILKTNPNMKSIMKMNATIYTLYFITFRWECNIKMDLNTLRTGDADLRF